MCVVLPGRYGLLVRRGESYGVRERGEGEGGGSGKKAIVMMLLAILVFLGLICLMLLLLYYFYYPMGRSHDSHMYSSLDLFPLQCT